MKTATATLGALTVLIASLCSPVAHAASCGIAGSATANPAIYDPFNPAGLATTTITLPLTRINPHGGGTTSVVNLYLKSNNTGADGTIIVPTTVTGQVSVAGTGANIFYNYAATPPVVSPTTLNPPGTYPGNFLQISFTGNNTGSDTATVTFNVTLPAGLNLQATQNLAFDAYFACNTQGGADNGIQQTGTIANAVSFPIIVLSALRTYYAGTALDFGEIGAVTNAQAPTYKTAIGNYVAVQSSGAYGVTLSSQNGFLLKKPSAATINDQIAYSLKFLGTVVDHGGAPSPTAGAVAIPSPGATAISKSCMRAGIGTNQALYIQATLEEGGSGKNPSPTYQDVLTVTVTPLIDTNAGTYNCPNL